MIPIKSKLKKCSTIIYKGEEITLDESIIKEIVDIINHIEGTRQSHGQEGDAENCRKVH